MLRCMNDVGQTTVRHQPKERRRVGPSGLVDAAGLTTRAAAERTRDQRIAQHRSVRSQQKPAISARGPRLRRLMSASRRVLFRIFERHERWLQQANLRPQQSKSMVDWGMELSLPRALRYGWHFVGAWYDIDRPRLLRARSGGSAVRDLVGPKYEFSPVDPRRYADVSRSDTTRLVPWPGPRTARPSRAFCTVSRVRARRSWSRRPC